MTKVYAATSLTGGGSGTLDGISGTPLVDMDMAMALHNGLMQHYILDEDSALAENAPLVISPDTAPGTKRWIMQYNSSWVRAEWFGFSSSATAANNKTYLDKAIATGSTNICIVTPGDYALDNTSPVTLSTNKLYFWVGPGVNIVPSVNTATVFRITGARITYDGGTITGDGTYNITGSVAGRPIAFIEVTDDAGEDGTQDLGYAQNVTVKNVTMVNPNNCGIAFHRTVGGKALNNKLKSGYNDVWVQGIFGIDVYSSAQILIDGNTIDGFIQGVCGGGTSTYTFNDYAGTTANANTRDIVVTNNHIPNFRDHGVYFSSYTNRINVINNSMVTTYASSGEAIKLCWIGNVVANNMTVSVKGGFVGRALRDTIITGNRFYISGTATALVPIRGIVIAGETDAAYDVVGNHPENIKITNNLIESSGSIGHGIYIYALKKTSDGSQNLIKNLTITGNTITGVASCTDEAYRSPIFLYQEEHDTPASSVYGENVIITGNKLISSSCLYGIAMSLLNSLAGFDNVIITDNIIKGVDDGGSVMYLQIKNSIVRDNTYQAKSGWVPGTIYGIREVVNTHTPCSNNYFGKLNYLAADINSGLFHLASETSMYEPLEATYSASLAGDASLSAATPYKKMIFNPTANRAITLSAAASANFPIGYSVQVHNISGANNLTFELVSGGGTVTITPQTHKTFYCTGSNTFIDAY